MAYQYDPRYVVRKDTAGHVVTRIKVADEQSARILAAKMRRTHPESTVEITPTNDTPGTGRV